LNLKALVLFGSITTFQKTYGMNLKLVHLVSFGTLILKTSIEKIKSDKANAFAGTFVFFLHTIQRRKNQKSLQANAQRHCNMTTDWTTEEERTANSTYKKLAVQWLNETLCFVSSSVLADSFVLQNRQLLVAANRYR
jgi:hypothetical protein